MVDEPPDRAAIDRACLRLEIRGRVQGVWYRGSARAEAEGLGLAGWARNRADGCVEILVQGEPRALERFVEWCRHGPPGARVTGVSRFEEPPDDSLTDFRIRT